MTDETRWKPDKVQVRNAGLHLDEPYAAWGSGIMDVFDQVIYLFYYVNKQHPHMLDVALGWTWRPSTVIWNCTGQSEYG